MTVSISGTGGVTFNDSSVQDTAATGFGFKNRIINGAMVISQRGTSFAGLTNGSNQYTVDRWRWAESGTFTGVQTVTKDSSAPSGFTASLKVETTTAVASLASGESCRVEQMIEGYNIADLAWGTADAKSITLSFWARSSLTGTFGGGISNSDTNRSYPFTYSISAANTWEYKTVVVSGDTTGTWLADSGVGMRVRFGLGVGSTLSGTAGAWAAADYQSATGAVSVVGTSGATFYVTGVQLEKGSTATSFDYRPYGTELALCQRYYFKMLPASGSQAFGVGFNDSTTAARAVAQFPVVMRTSPTALEQTGTAGDYQIRFTGGAATTCSSVPSFSDSNPYTATFIFTVASGLTGGQASLSRAVNSTAFLAWSAEL